MERKVLEELQAADMVLIGIGEEFEERAFLEAQPEYESTAKYLEHIGCMEQLPLLADEILREKGHGAAALNRLYQAVKDKNFFLVSTCKTDSMNRI